jgi:spermidine/putrescine-binding protein
MNIALATPLKDGGLNSAFTYNGDILYAAMGSDLNAGIESDNPKYIQYFDDKDNDPNVLHMHFIRPDYVPAMMDMMVINKNSTKSTTKKDDIYNVVRKICLDSSNEQDDTKFDDDISFQN